MGLPTPLCASPNPPASPPLHDKKPQTNPQTPSRTPQARPTAAEGRQAGMHADRRGQARRETSRQGGEGRDPARPGPGQAGLAQQGQTIHLPPDNAIHEETARRGWRSTEVRHLDRGRHQSRPASASNMSSSRLEPGPKEASSSEGEGQGPGRAAEARRDPRAAEEGAGGGPPWHAWRKSWSASDAAQARRASAVTPAMRRDHTA